MLRLALTLLALTLTTSACAGRAAAAGRAPPASAWRIDPYPLSDHFDAGELGRWKEHRRRHRRVNMLALVLDLATYLLLLGAPGRALFGLAGRLARPIQGPAASRTGRLDRLMQRVLGQDWMAALIFAYLYFALGVVLDLPLSIWHETIARDAGLSTYTASRWIGDFFKALFVSSILFTLLVVGLYGLIRRYPRRFWLVLALPVALGTVGSTLLAPYGPRLYHQITPIEQTRFADAKRAQRLRRLASAGADLRLEQIKVVDTSLRSRMLGAYITGLGPTRELVLSDTLLELATLDELEVVVAHELGHVRKGSPLLMTALTALALVGLLALFAVVLRVGARVLHLDGPADMRTLPLLGLCALLLFNLALPLRNARSRTREREADRFALTLTQKPDAFISLQVKLARRNREDVRPSRWIELWLFGHPPTAERIGMARWYRRWLSTPGRAQ